MRLAEERSPLPKAQERESNGIAQGRELSPGDPVGEYVIVRRLGEGGFGTVYEAYHPIIGKRAAVKVLHAHYSANESITSRFIAEARAVNQIRHKNIVDIFSFGDLSDGRHYYVMELLEGAPLDAYLERRGQLPVEQALPILHAIAKALGAAHEANILHRDLKPENVFLELDGEGVIDPKLLDFGMAKLLQSGSAPIHRTRSNAPIGSPRYMSPEQCRGLEVDGRTDIYAFGCIAYRMLTGRLPFDAGTALELLMAHVSTPPVPPSHHCPELGTEFDEPLLRLLEKRPEARPQTLSLAYDSLLKAAEKQGFKLEDPRVVLDESFAELVRARQVDHPTPSPTPQHSGVGRARKVAAKRRSWVIGLGVSVAVTVVVGFTLSRQSRNATLTRFTSEETPKSAQIQSAITTPVTTLTGRQIPPAPSVSITVLSQPSNADAYLGSRRLGTTPGPFELSRSDEPVTLTVQAKGHVPTTVIVRPTQDSRYEVTLPKRLRRTPSHSTPGDLEDPY